MKLILAIDRKGVMGNEGKLPWKLPDDLKHFKQETYGSTIVMGSGTFCSLPTLPNRKHIVLSRKINSSKGKGTICGMGKQDLFFYNSIDSMLDDLKDKDNVYLIGGANVVQQLFPHVTEAIITHVDADIEVYDTAINLDLSDFTLCSSVACSDPKNEHPFHINRYIRSSPRKR